MQELYKIIVALVVVLIGSWTLFGWIVKRWITSTDAKIKELDDNIDKNNINIGVISAVCEERCKNDKKK